MYPNDLYYRFLQEADQNPNYINKSLNLQYTKDIMANHCFNPIKQSEIEYYNLNNKPSFYCEFVVTPNLEYNYSYYHGILRETNRYDDYEEEYSYANSRYLEYVKTKDGKTVGDGTYEELPFGWKYNYKNHNKEYKLPKTSFIVGYDLVTTYYVLKNRLSCKDNFAKKSGN